MDPSICRFYSAHCVSNGVRECLLKTVPTQSKAIRMFKASVNIKRIILKVPLLIWSGSVPKAPLPGKPHTLQQDVSEQNRDNVSNTPPPPGLQFVFLRPIQKGRLFDGGESNRPEDGLQRGAPFFFLVTKRRWRHHKLPLP